MNTFYQKNQKTQQVVAWFMIIILVVCLVSWYRIDSALIKGGMVFLIIPLYLFLSTPLFTIHKRYNYVSPMLLYIKRGENTFELHSGTSFDYLLIIKGLSPGKDWKLKMQLYYINGLSKIVSKIKDGIIPQTATIKGTSYFMENAIIKKLGFTLSEPDAPEKINFWLGYLDLIWMHSLANGKLRFPKMKDLKKAEISGEQLLAAEDSLNQYKTFLLRKQNSIK